MALGGVNQGLHRALGPLRGGYIEENVKAGCRVQAEGAKWEVSLESGPYQGSTRAGCQVL